MPIFKKYQNLKKFFFHKRMKLLNYVFKVVIAAVEQISHGNFV